MADEMKTVQDEAEVSESRNFIHAFIEEDIDGAHPNTAEITLTDADGRSALIQGASIGGGNIVINKINDTEVSISGKSDTLVIPHDDVPGMIAVVTNILAEKGVNVHGFSLGRDRKGGIAVMTIEIDGNIDESINEAIMECPNIHASTILKAI